MRIAHVIARINIGGTASWLRILSEGLIAHGHEVLLIVGNVQAGEVEDLNLASQQLVRVDSLGRSISPYRDLRSFWALRKAIKKWRPDVVNTHTAKAGILGRLATRSIGGRQQPALVHTVHGHLLTGYFSKTAVSAITYAERRMAAISDLVLASGKEVAAELTRVGAVPSSKLRIVHPGVRDMALIGRGSALRHLCLDQTPREQLVVGWLARITDIKRPDRLLEVAQMNPDALFLVGGDGPLRALMESTAPSNVRFTGWTSPEWFWPACDLALLTSDNEAIPYSLIEAALASVPAVATDVGAVRSAIVNHVTGMLVPPDSQAVAFAVRELLGDQHRRLHMGQAARRYALETFSPDAMVELHSRFYHESIALRR